MDTILKLANLVQSEVDALLAETYDDPYYKYYHVEGYLDYRNDNNQNNWNKESYVSVNSKGTIIGYFHARIDRNTRGVVSLSAINFERTGNGALFAIDFRRFIEKLFVERNYYRIAFYVVTDNPIMSMYNRFIRDYNGRVVGTFTRSERLSDGKFYDAKHYEIFLEDFMKVKKRKDAMNNDRNSPVSLDTRT